jgi:hypothetical protein
VSGQFRRCAIEEPYDGHSALLRKCSKRPRSRRASEKFNQLAPLREPSGGGALSNDEA